MTDTTTDDADVVKNLASQGVKQSDLDPGQSGTGGASKPPAEPSNKAPEPDPKDKDKEAAGDPPEGQETGKDKKDPAKDDKPEPPITEWAKFDNPHADAVVDLLKEKGLSPAEANAYFAKAIESGDLKDIDYDGLEKRIGKAATHLTKTGITNWHVEATESTNAVTKAAYEMYGGKEAWDTVAAWAKVREGQDAEFAKELAGIRKDLNIGGRAANAALRDLLSIYNGNPNTKGLDNTKLEQGSRQATSKVTPISRTEYVELLSKAEAKGDKNEIASLHRRRTAGMKAGI